MVLPMSTQKATWVTILSIPFAFPFTSDTVCKLPYLSYVQAS